MGYVMVPVPEEFVQEAMKMVIRLSQGDRFNDWDAEAIAQLFEDMPEMSKAVLSAVARGTLSEEGSVKEDVLARSLEHSIREVREIAREINTHAHDNAFGSVISITTSTETLPNGRTRDDRRFRMEEHVAQWVREAERDEAKRNPNPLLGSGG
ncbi:MAG: hypothetical protein KDB02_09190 [Acidimicrobiales bacterium]|nr:hypothetical protein [Acidimicrobiales bacterium]